MNRLQHETSPYLLQHAHNPVDWYAWKPEAFEKARAEDKPILVSIGYSTCHWCHVMERESFENQQVADYMNEHFVNIKVDREERPDVDQIYMEACVAISGSGGWPLNAFLLPDRRPFFAGTYYPPQSAHGRPSWLQVLHNMRDVYQNKREVVEEQAAKMIDYMERSDNTFLNDPSIGPQSSKPINPVVLQNIFFKLKESFDTVEGGFGGAPKFPAAMNLQFMLEYHYYQKDSLALEHVEFSLEKMIRGGIYDQLGGGFARYATDRSWLVPHFEKMLYDNALLIKLLASAFQYTGKELYKETIEETLAYIQREMTSEEGGFYAAQDADSEGVEGKFYVWNKSEIDAALGSDAELFNAFYGVTEGGNWEGKNILWRPESFKIFARSRNLEVAELKQQLKEARQKLFALRSKRIYPGLDDKILLSWNALMATAYAHAYMALGHEEYRQVARRNVEFLMDRMQQPEGQGLFHTYKEGKAQYDAFLEDYAFLIEALIDVYTITGEARFLENARQYTAFVQASFFDDNSKMYYFTKADQSDIPLRRKDLYDSAVPSGNSTMAQNLQRLAVLLGEASYHRQALEMLLRMRETAERYPTSFGRWSSAMLQEAYPIREIAVVGADHRAMLEQLLSAYLPNAVFMSASKADDRYPLLAGKGDPDDTRIYVCQDFVCQQPVKTIAEFEQLVGGKSS